MEKCQHSLEDCPLRNYGCIITTDVSPYRILDLDTEALDLFLAGYLYDDLPQHQQPPASPLQDHDLALDDQFEYPDEQAHAHAKALRFLMGLHMTDILEPDTLSCLTAPAPSGVSISAFLSAEKEGSLQPFVLCEDAMLSNNYEQDLSLQPTPRRVHVCIHSLSTQMDNQPSSHQSSEDDSDGGSSTGGYRLFHVKDVTEMHGLAAAARSGIMAKGRHRQRQQPFITQRILAHKHKHSRSSSSVPQQDDKHDDSDNDSGILLADIAWENNNNNDNSNTDAAGSAMAASSSLSPSSLLSTDPGLLVIQVTRFGTVDHAFAIPQLDYPKSTDRFGSLPYEPEFLAQDQIAIEAMASEALMSYVHPEDLLTLCKNLNQICKALYTVFRARWRVDALPQPSVADREEDEEDVDDATRAAYASVENASRAIEFQGELFEEWVDPSVSLGRYLLARKSSDGYAWTEMTGVLANGNPVLVVRPLTMPEVEEQESTGVMSMTSKVLSESRTSFVDIESEDDEGILDMEMKLDMDMELDQALVITDAATSLDDRKAQKDLARRRMDVGEGLCLSMSGMQGLSDLRYRSASPRLSTSSVSSLSSSTSSTSCLSVSSSSSTSSSSTIVAAHSQSRCRGLHHHHQHHHHHHHQFRYYYQQRQQRQNRLRRLHSGRQSLLFAFSPANSSWPTLSSVALEAWNEWVQTLQLSKDQLQAWCEYLMEIALSQTISTVAFGMTLMGYDAESLPLYLYPFLTQSWSMMDIKRQQQQRQQQQKVWEISTEDGAASAQEVQELSSTTTATKLSGLDRAGKVLEANYPALDGVVRQIGKSWIGQRIIVKSRLDERLDFVADRAFDWWESEDRVATLTTAVPLLNTAVPLLNTAAPLLNTLTTYTPLGYFVTRMKK
ncbi:hypothetical protein BGZ98_005062 [Dissophora globulifera]|nr:hypothetical protein BGZ98_005062 [Dissophora globulifera]